MAENTFDKKSCLAMLTPLSRKRGVQAARRPSGYCFQALKLQLTGPEQGCLYGNHISSVTDTVLLNFTGHSRGKDVPVNTTYNSSTVAACALTSMVRHAQLVENNGDTCVVAQVHCAHLRLQALRCRRNLHTCMQFLVHLMYLVSPDCRFCRFACLLEFHRSDLCSRSSS